jgi:hypothetical protein
MVEDSASGDPKFLRLGELLNIDPVWAFGLSVSLWCLCWRKKFYDERLNRYTPSMLAAAIGWNKRPASALIDAMLEAEILAKDEDGTLRAKNWRERQGVLVRKIEREQKAREEKKTSRPPSQAGPAGDNTVVKLLLDRMRENHITGGAHQKREHAEAWHAAGLTQKAEEIIMGEGKNKDIFWIARALNGTPGQKATAEDRSKKLVEDIKRRLDNAPKP